MKGNQGYNDLFGKRHHSNPLVCGGLAHLRQEPLICFDLFVLLCLFVLFIWFGLAINHVVGGRQRSPVPGQCRASGSNAPLGSGSSVCLSGCCVCRKRKHLEKIIGSGINRGLNSVKRIVKEHRIPGVYGPIMELFKCSHQLFTAVEVSVGNSLFNVVVETHETALKIIGYLNQEKAGRVKFMPLDKLHPKVVTPPKEYGTDVVPMVRKLKFDAKFERAFREVFGRTMICKTIDIASEVARSAQLNCVTVDGDQANKKGALSGGYCDQGRSKLEAFMQLRQALKASEGVSGEKERLAGLVLGVDQGISQVLGEMQKMEAQVEHLKECSNQVYVLSCANYANERCKALPFTG